MILISQEFFHFGQRRIAPLGERRHDAVQKIPPALATLHLAAAGAGNDARSHEQNRADFQIVPFGDGGTDSARTALDRLCVAPPDLVNDDESFFSGGVHGKGSAPTWGAGPDGNRRPWLRCPADSGSPRG